MEFLNEFLNEVRVNAAIAPMSLVWFNLVVFLLNALLIPAAWMSGDVWFIVINTIAVVSCGHVVFTNLDRIKENFNS